MNISSIVNKFKLQPYKFLYENKDYQFSCTLENAINKDVDFIFIPLVYSADFEAVLDKAFKNPNCKGVVFNNKLLDSNKYKVWFSSFMKIFGSQVEFLAFVPNIYNLTLSIILEKLMYYNGEIITAVGTEGTSEVVEMLDCSLNSCHKITGTKFDWTCWQKLFEPILMAEDDTEFIILEAIPEKLGLVPIVQNFPNNNIIFTKSSLYNMNLYEDLKSLSDELLRVLANPSFVKSITLSQDNDLIVDYIPYSFSDRINFADDEIQNISCVDTELEYLKPYYLLVKSFFSRKFPEADCNLGRFSPYEKLYDIYKKNHLDYFVINPQKVSVNSVLKSLDEFNNMYLDKNKIVILEYIKSLGEFKQSVYDEILSKLARMNPTRLILVNINNFNHLFRRLNNTTYLQNAKCSVENSESIDQLKFLLKTLEKENNAAIYIRLNENTMKLLSEEGNEIFA